ncbi:MAG: DUF488 domain-containing protein [Planctomycetota bacterium]
MIRIAHVRDRIPRRCKRFLVERSWPRRVDRDELALDGWFKDAAPTFDLSRWYGGKLERWMEFRDDYRAQLEDQPRTWRKLLLAAREGDIVLLHADKDPDYNQAAVLKEFLESALETEDDA